MARSCPGLELLRKDMLVYELRIREENSEGTVPELINRLRGVLDKPVSITEDNTGEVAASLDVLEPLISEVSKSFSYLEQPTTKQVERLRAHLAHLASRVHDVKTLTVKADVLERVENLSTEIERLMGRLTPLGMEKGDDSLGGGLAGGLHTSHPRDDGLVSPNFANLPNPIMCMFRGVDKLTITTKGGIKQLLWFLVDLEQQSEIFRLQVAVLWALLYPLTDSCLRTLVGQALKEGMSFKAFREQIIKSELPFRWYLELEQEFLWRIQGEGETLRQYIDRVRIASLALNPSMDEEQVVRNVVEGLLPQHRTSLLVLGRPQDWETLLKQVKDIERFALLDEQRAGSMGNPRGVNQTGERLRVEGPRPRVDARRCFRCNSTNHLVRQCPIPRTDR